jgi:adenylate cyclase
VDRKLAAILAADVVSYSALMERDEKGTYERLKAEREQLFEPEIARHHGRVFKLMGDGMLAEFGSVVDAVECAVSLQRGLAERNAEAPDDQRIQVRIGINLGEMIVEGDDRFGEGVNIATRLQQLAEPGGIWVSGKVAKEVEKKLAFGFEPMGAQRVKNIAEPIQTFRVKLDGGSVKRHAPVSARRLAPWAASLAAIATLAAIWFVVMAPADAPATSATIPSIAVLPFDNMGGDPALTYFGDGVAEDIISMLARSPDLSVIARNSSFTYKGKATDIRQVGKGPRRRLCA